MSPAQCLTVTLCSSGSPVAARPIVTNLCKRNTYRAFAPQYRLGPQHTFPAQLLDALVAYFFLIAPPPGASHQAIPPCSIVFVGESAGASLALAVMQALLHIRRKQTRYTPKLLFHGHEIAVDLPAGCAVLNVAGDWTLSLPSNQRHLNTDILVGEPWLQPDFPPDSIWPTDPPRGEAFCHPTALCHPLISPTLCRDWTGAPPMWICSGEEVLADSMMLIDHDWRSGLLDQNDNYRTHPKATLARFTPQRGSLFATGMTASWLTVWMGGYKGGQGIIRQGCRSPLIKSRVGTLTPWQRRPPLEFDRILS